MPDAGAYGRQLADVFGLDVAPVFAMRTLSHGPVAATMIRCTRENNGLTAPIPPEDALLVTLQLQDCARHDLWIDGKPMRTGALAAGMCNIYDLRQNPVVNSISSFHNIHFYLPRAVLNDIARLEDEARAVDEVPDNPGLGIDDLVIRGLGLSLVAAFERPDEANQLFVDHVTMATAAHVTRRLSGQAGEVMAAAGLDVRQLDRAKERLATGLSGDLTIAELASDAGLPVGRFRDGFRAATGCLPHQWLMQRRVERAMDLLGRTRMSLAAVAQACGFVSEQHLVRVFSGQTGLHPTRWRQQKS